MRCENLRPLVEKLVDGACSSEDKARVEAHLSICGACREQYAVSKAIMEAARRTPIEEPPAAYWELLPRKVMARIEREGEAKTAPGGFWNWLAPARLRWLGLVAVGLIAVVVSLEILQEAESPKAPEPALTRSSAGQGAPAGAVETLPGRKEPSAGGVSSRPAKEKSRKEASAPASKDSSAQPKTPPPSLPSPGPAKEKADVTPARAFEVEKPTGAPARPAVAPSDKARRAERADSAVAVETDRARRDVDMGGKAEAVAVPEPKTAEVLAEEPARPSEGVSRVEQAGNLQALSTLRVSKTTSYPATLGEAKTLSMAELEARCGALRKSLGTALPAPELVNARHRLALCSMHLFNLYPTEQRRRRAIDDAKAFLALFPEGKAADQIRAELEQIQPKQR